MSLPVPTLLSLPPLWAKAHPTELLVGCRRLRAVTLTDQLNHSFAAIDRLAQYFAEIAAFGAKNILPHRFVAEEAQCVGDQLPGAP